MWIIAFITDPLVVVNIVNHLKLAFAAAKPPPPPTIYQKFIMDAEAISEYLLWLSLSLERRGLREFRLFRSVPHSWDFVLMSSMSSLTLAPYLMYPSFRWEDSKIWAMTYSQLWFQKVNCYPFMRYLAIRWASCIILGKRIRKDTKKWWFHCLGPKIKKYLRILNKIQM